MKRLIILFFLCAAVCLGDNTWARSDGDWFRDGGNWGRSAVAPVPSPTPFQYDYDFASHAGDEDVYTVDLSENNRTGTVVGAGVSFVAATNGLKDIYSMDGTASSGIQINGTNATTFFSGKTNVTQNIWIKVNTSTAEDGVLCSRGSAYSLLSLGGSTDAKINANPGGGVGSTGAGTVPAGEWVNITWTGQLLPSPAASTNIMYINGVEAARGAGAGSLTYGQDDEFIIGWDDAIAGRAIDADYAIIQHDSGRGTIGTWTPANILETNIVQAAQVGVLSGFAEANRDVLAVCSNIVTCNQGFQDWRLHSVADSSDLPALAGTPDIGWGAGNGVAEHLVVVGSNRSNIMFTAGASAATMTNYAVIDGVQYFDGSAQSFSNTFYETTATSNTFWRYDGSSFYAGNIAQIHQGGAALTEAMYIDFDTYVKANINWNP